MAKKDKIWQKRMPLLATLFGGILMTGLAGNLLWRLETLTERLVAGAALLAYALWMRWESRVSLAELGREAADHDHFSMEYAALCKLITLALCLWYTREIVMVRALSGFALFFAGMSLRMAAVKALRDQYSHRIRRPAFLVESGIYQRLRHPAYSGTFILHTGIVMLFFNTPAVLALIFLWGSAVLLRTLLEERYLSQFSDYRTYSQRVPAKLIPLIW